MSPLSSTQPCSQSQPPSPRKNMMRHGLELYCWSKWTLTDRYRRRSFKFMPPDISSAQHRVNWSIVPNWIICTQTSQVPRPTPWNLCTVHLDIVCTFGSRCRMDWCPCGCQLSCLHTLWSLVWWRWRCQPLPAQVLSMPARLPADSWWSSTLHHSCECSWPFLCLCICQCKSMSSVAIVLL